MPNKLLKLSGIDKISSKRDFVEGSVVYGTEQTTIFCIHLNEPPGQKVMEKPKITLQQNQIKPSELTLLFCTLY